MSFGTRDIINQLLDLQDQSCTHNKNVFSQNILIEMWQTLKITSHSIAHHQPNHNTSFQTIINMTEEKRFTCK